VSAFPSAYLDDRILESIFKNTAFTPPASVYLALYTTNPSASDTGTEVTGGSYSRKVLAFAASAGATIASNASVTFSALAAATITHYGVRDASTGGNLLVYGALPNPVVTNAGDDVTIASGSISFSISGS
jgi:hypothetical protein